MRLSSFGAKQWSIEMNEDEFSIYEQRFEDLKSAALDLAKPVVARIADAVVSDFKDRAAVGTFGDLSARHLWDEYSWNRQEGPFDIDMGWDDVSLCSPSSAFEDLVLVVALAELEKQPKHMQVFLSVLAFESNFDFSDSDEGASLGTIWLDGIAKLVVDQVNERASQRSLDLIGPYRGDCIQSASGDGVVWSLLEDRGDAWDITTDHIDDLIDPDSDLEPLASALLDGFIAAAKEDTGDTMVVEFFEQYEQEIRNLLMVDDVMRNLLGMRAELVKQLDGQ
jgi:hypothetical protein